MPYSRSDILNQNTSDFPNNNSGQITPAILRDFNANYVNSVQFIGDPTDSASYAISASFANSSSYAVNASAALTATTASYSNTSTSASYSNTSTSASYALTASFALNGGGTTIDTGSFVTTSSFNAYTSSTNTFTQSIQTQVNSLAAATSSYITSAQTSSMSVLSASFAVTASFLTGVIASASFATSASYALNATSASYALNATTASFASTIASGLNITTSNILVTNDLTVNGTASFSYVKTVTGSAVIIGDEFIILNADTPTAPFAGIQVYDTGSASTASFEWNGNGDYWIAVEETGQSSAFLTGASGSKGSETFPSANRLTKGTGNNTIIDSSITDNGSTVSINSNTLVTGSLTVTAGITGSLLGTASYATQALSASFAPSVAAFPFTGSADITGSLNLIGNASLYTGSLWLKIMIQDQIDIIFNHLLLNLIQKELK